MKVTKKNLQKFVNDWMVELDENPQIKHPADVLHDLEVEFGLAPKKPKTLMEVFEEENYYHSEEQPGFMNKL